MKRNIQPTQTEIPLAADDVIVSKTDLSGRVTYVNRTFMRISNYPEHEVLGKQHNIIRHPDMPRGVYRLMWDTLKDGREFFGVVKNMTADGHFYWVFANVTLDWDAKGATSGYFSVRRRVSPAAIRSASALYAEMLRIEREAGPANAPAASIAYLQEKLAAAQTTYDRFALELYQQH